MRLRLRPTKTTSYPLTSQIIKSKNYLVCSIRGHNGTVMILDNRSLSFVSFCLFWLSEFRFFIFERFFADYKLLVACDHIFVYEFILTMLSFKHLCIYHLLQRHLYWKSCNMVKLIIRQHWVLPRGTYDEADVNYF